MRTENVGYPAVSCEDAIPSAFLRLSWRGFATSACLLAIPVASEAAPVFTINPSLNPGDHYRVAFLTSTVTVATSLSIATYNSFVTSAAGASSLSLPSATWLAIASTAAVNAIDNIDCGPSCGGDPIYLVDGTKVATSTTALFNSTLSHAIDLTENGIAQSSPDPYTWTGTTTGGVATANPLGSAFPTQGDYIFTTAGWLNVFPVSSASTRPLYAISSDLVVPGTTVAAPAPGGAPLFALGGLLTFMARKLRRGQRLTA